MLTATAGIGSPPADFLPCYMEVTSVLTRHLLGARNLEGRVFAIAFWNHNIHQCRNAILGSHMANHTSENMMYVSLQQPETNNTKITGS